MSFGSRLKEKREALGITQPQLAQMLGVSKGAIGNWETDVNSPRTTLLYDLFDILNCDANYLFQDETRELYKNEATPDEFENIIKKYRFISDYSPDGIKIVDTILNREYAIAEQLHRQTERIKELETAGGDSETKVRFIQYYQRLASAGSGQIVFDNLPTEQIAIPDIPKYRKVSYAIGVNGRSMEPMYHNGETLLVEKTNEIEVGEIGIFMVNGESYVKKLGENELVSVNDDYGNIPLCEGCRCMGRVIDRYMSERERSAMEVGLHALQNALSGNEMIG